VGTHGGSSWHDGKSCQPVGQNEVHSDEAIFVFLERNLWGKKGTFHDAPEENSSESAGREVSRSSQQYDGRTENMYLISSKFLKRENGTTDETF